MRHAKSRLHQLAVQDFADTAAKNALAASSIEFLGPPEDEWRKCLQQFRDGKSARDGRGTSDRIYLMRWCLSECMLQHWRKQLRTAKVLVLIRDERQGRLQIRFRATSSNFSVLSGVFGCEELCIGKKAIDIDIHNATKAALKEFCTERSGAPRGFNGPAPKVDSELLAALKEKCEMIVTDCASADVHQCSQQSPACSFDYYWFSS